MRETSKCVTPWLTDSVSELPVNLIQDIQLTLSRSTEVMLTSLSVHDKTLSLVFSVFDNNTEKVIASKSTSVTGSTVWLDVEPPCLSAAVFVQDIPDIDFSLGAPYTVRRSVIAVVPNEAEWPPTKLSVRQDGTEQVQEVYNDVSVTTSRNLHAHLDDIEVDGEPPRTALFIELPDETKSELVRTYQTVELAEGGIFKINNVAPNEAGELSIEIDYPMNEVTPVITGSRVVLGCKVTPSPYSDPIDNYISPAVIGRDSNTVLPLDSAYKSNDDGTFTRATKDLLAKYNELDPLFDTIKKS